MIISHSQDFLNGVCTNIIHMHKQKLVYYGVRSVNYFQLIIASSISFLNLFSAFSLSGIRKTNRDADNTVVCHTISHNWQVTNRYKVCMKVGLLSNGYEGHSVEFPFFGPSSFLTS